MLASSPELHEVATSSNRSGVSARRRVTSPFAGSAYAADDAATQARGTRREASGAERCHYGRRHEVDVHDGEEEGNGCKGPSCTSCGFRDSLGEDKPLECCGACEGGVGGGYVSKRPAGSDAPVGQ
jgi:hypothetical protein